MTDDELLIFLKGALKEDLLSHTNGPAGPTIYVPPSIIPKVLMYLRDHTDLLFRQLVDLFSIDYPERAERFEVVYLLLSLRFNRRLCVKVRIPDGMALPSVTSVFRAAGWSEREVWDMMGIPFDGHPDLRRLLTDYGFDGHPLRKDFPLTGYVEVHYDLAEKRVKYDAVRLPQAYRSFDFLSPWGGAGMPLPGDEKAGEPTT